jgi:hypothetical protein
LGSGEAQDLQEWLLTNFVDLLEDPLRKLTEKEFAITQPLREFIEKEFAITQQEVTSTACKYKSMNLARKSFVVQLYARETEDTGVSDLLKILYEGDTLPDFTIHFGPNTSASDVNHHQTSKSIFLFRDPKPKEVVWYPTEEHNHCSTVLGVDGDKIFISLHVSNMSVVFVICMRLFILSVCQGSGRRSCASSTHK